MKKKVLILLMSLILALGLIACSEAATNPFKEYGYENPPASDKDWRDLEGDADMTVDGVLDEANWTDKNALEFTTGYNNGDVKISVTAHLGEKGLYIGTTVKDDYLFYNENRTVYNNTSVELHIAQIDASALDKNVIQLRFGLNGYTEQWIGVASADGYAYSRIYVPNMARIQLTGEGAEINKRVAGQGFVLETFVPYTSFGLDLKPEKVKIGPAYNHVRDANEGNSERLHKDAPGMSYTDPVSFAVFDANGYSKGDSEALAQEKEIDGDLSDWANMTDVQKNKVKIVDKNENGKQVEFMAYLGADGLYLAADATHQTYVDNNQTDWFKNTNFELFINGGEGNNDANHRWVTPDKASNTNVKGGLGAMKNEKGSEGLVRQHTTVEVFLPFRAIPGYKEGDTYVRVGFAFKTVGDMITAGHAKYSAGGNAEDDWWYAMGHKPSDVSLQYYVKDIGILETENPIEPIETTVTVDGKTDDWTEEMKRNPVVVKDKDTNKGFTAYAFLDKTGMYVAVEAKHSQYVTDDKEWHLNTNVELQVQGPNQCYINSRGQKNIPVALGAEASMITTDTNSTGGGDVNTRYLTVAEFFIPSAALKAWGYNEQDEFARVGIAFKTRGDNVTIGGDHPVGEAGIWWWAKNHRPNDKNQQYYVKADGLHETPKPVVVTMEIDGDLSDWTNATVNSNMAIVQDNDTEKGFAVRSFLRAGEGMYVAYEAKHSLYKTDAKDGNNVVQWFLCTNAEMKIFGDHQLHVSAKGATATEQGDVDLPAGAQSFMKTTDSNEEGSPTRYTTIVELFIPESALANYGYKAEAGYVNIGFAFKTGGDNIQSGHAQYSADLADSDWWYPKGHAVGNLLEQFFVTENGIVDRETATGITLDGALTDWQALENWDQINASKIGLYDKDDAEHGVTFYGFANAKGAYFYYDVTHYVNAVDSNKAWHQNPNAEFFMGAGRKQYWVSAKPETNGIFAYMNTQTVTEGSKWHTVVEVFIPYCQFGGVNADGNVIAQIAWKMDNGSGQVDKITVSDDTVWAVSGRTDQYWSVNVTVGANGLAIRRV